MRHKHTNVSLCGFSQGSVIWCLPSNRHLIGYFCVHKTDLKVKIYFGKNMPLCSWAGDGSQHNLLHISSVLLSIEPFSFVIFIHSLNVILYFIVLLTFILVRETLCNSRCGRFISRNKCRANSAELLVGVQAALLAADSNRFCSNYSFFFSLLFFSA